MARKRFFADGLHFECTGCGNCCRLGGGFVYPSDEDIRYLAHHLGLILSEFADRFLEVHENRFVLTSEGDDCIFLKDNACSVYDVRPTQCRTFPFWPANLKSRYRWKLIAEDCEGIGRGRLYSKEEIDRILLESDDTEAGPAASTRNDSGKEHQPEPTDQ